MIVYRYILCRLIVHDVSLRQTQPTGWLFFFQAEDGIRDLVRSRGLGDVYKRQLQYNQLRCVRFSMAHGIDRLGAGYNNQGPQDAVFLSLIHI